MTASSLRNHSCKDLAQMARAMGLARLAFDAEGRAGPGARQPRRSAKSRESGTNGHSATAVLHRECQRRPVGESRRSRRPANGFGKLRAQIWRKTGSLRSSNGTATRTGTKKTGWW